MFAEASNAFAGQWFYVAVVAINAVGVLVGIIFVFATKRDVEQLEKRADKQDDDIKAVDDKVDALPTKLADMESRLTAQGERRSSIQHNRINPLVENTSALKAGMEAHNENFRNFTEFIKALLGERKGS